MRLTLDLPPAVEAALRADAEAQDLPIEALAAERLAAYYDEDVSDEPDPDAVEGIRRGLEDLKAGRMVPLEDYINEVIEQRRQRDAPRKAAA